MNNEKTMKRKFYIAIGAGAFVGGFVGCATTFAVTEFALRLMIGGKNA